jgi:hypothetical protein
MGRFWAGTVQVGMMATARAWEGWIRECMTASQCSGSAEDEVVLTKSGYHGNSLLEGSH